MTNKKQRQNELQNNVFVLSNRLLTFSTELAERNESKRTTVAETIFNVLDQIGQKENNDKKTKELREAFSNVPLALHVQVLKSFTESFYIKNLIDVGIMPENEDTSKLSKKLLETVEVFEEYEQSILSPFEAIYLFALNLLKSMEQSNSTLKAGEIFLGDRKAQRTILMSFSDAYEDRYGLRLRKEEGLVDE